MRIAAQTLIHNTKQLQTDIDESKQEGNDKTRHLVFILICHTQLTGVA